MYLKVIKMTMRDQVKDQHYSSCFDYHAYFIGYYLAMQLRKDKFETNGTFEAIFIYVGDSDSQDSLRDNGVWKYLRINLKFDFDRYNSGNEEERCAYFIELYRKGLARAENLATIPYKRLMGYLDEIIRNHYVYTWKFRNMLIRPWGLKICFTATLTTNDFTIRAAVYKTGVKAPVCEGLVVRTKPRSMFFYDITKKMRIEGCKVFVGTAISDYFYLDFDELSRGEFVRHICEPPSDINEDCKEIFRKAQRYYMYEGNDL